MKTSYLFRPFDALLFFLFVIGCKNEANYTPWLYGDIRGVVYTFDQFGTILPDQSGVEVSTKGIDRNYSTTTDADGMFVLNNVPNGTYEIRFKKEGFGILKYPGVQHLGGKPTIIPENYDIEAGKRFFYLYEFPTSVITNIKIIHDSIFAHINVQGSSYPGMIFLKIFFSADPQSGTSNADVNIDYPLLYNNGIYSNTAWGYFLIDGKYYGDYFSPGDTVYFSAGLFTWVGWGVDKYFDFENQKWVYPNLINDPAVYSFILEK